MKRREFLALCALAALPARAWAAPDARFRQGLLWRVTRAGRTAGYVFGTIHMADARLATLPAPVRKALSAAKSLTVEFTANPYARERFLEASMFIDRQTLDEKIGADDFERVVEHLQPIGLSREFVRKLKPWGVLVNLRNPRSAGGPSVDELLFEQAEARRLPLHTMEGVEEQIFTFDEFPMDSQVALLKHALANQAALVEVSERTLQAYLRRDLAGIWDAQAEYVRRFPEIAEHNAVFTKRVIFDRSVVMAFRMQRQLRYGGAFIAIGAMHLYGEKGVLALLEDDGYRVRRVY